jgi:VanZ family protein
MRLSPRTWVRAITVAVAVGIVAVSMLPIPQPQVGDVPLADKIAHGLAYVVLGFLLFASQLPGPRPRLVLVSITGSLVLGGLIELVQPLASRHRELGDLIADLVGATVGVLLALALTGFLKRLLLRSRSRT